MVVSRICCRLLVVIVLVGTVIVSGCGSGQEPGQSANTTGPDPAPTFDLPELPTIAELAQLDTGRAVSYTEQTLVLAGSDYDGDLPFALITKQGPTGIFSPVWESGTTGLAYGIYKFYADGFDREPMLYYGFQTPPDDYADVWFALSNFDRGCWEWHKAAASGQFNLASMPTYMSTNGIFYMAWVAVGAEMRLAFSRLGPQQVTAELNASPSMGVTPLAVDMNASGSSTAVGTITKFEWDVHGDGEFELDTSDTDHYTYNYTEDGLYAPAVRVTNSLGEFAVAADTVDACQHWQHTWGTSGYEHLSSVMADGTEAIYAAGIRSFDGNDDVLLLKYDLDGQLQWARSWDSGGDDQVLSLDIGASGIYLAGYADPPGPTGQDMMVQCWDSDGNVAWTRLYDYQNHLYDQAQYVSVYSGAVYVAGRNSPSSTIYDGDGIVLSYDLDGNLNWERSFGGDQGEAATVVKGHRKLSGDTQIYVYGWSGGYGAGELSLLHAIYDTDGTMTSFKSWGAPGWRSTPVDAFVPGVFSSTPGYILATCLEAFGNNTLLLRETAGDPVAYVYLDEHSFNTYPFGMLLVGGKTYIAGYSFNAGYGFLLTLDSSENLVHDYKWDDTEPSVYAEFRGIGMFPVNGGLLLPGKALSSDGRTFHEAGFLRSPGPVASWVNLPLEQTDPNGAIQSPLIQSVDITSLGVMDTGGGEPDALLVATDL